MGRHYNRSKQPHGGQLPGSSGGKHNSPPARTNEKLAADYGVSAKTITEAGKFAAAVETLKAIDPAAVTTSARTNSVQGRIPPMDRAELIERARAGFDLVGRGIVVVLSGEAEARYASREDIKARIVAGDVPEDLGVGILMAIDRYEPKAQAVLLVELRECCTVSVVSYHRSELVASVSFADAN